MQSESSSSVRCERLQKQGCPSAFSVFRLIDAWVKFKIGTEQIVDIEITDEFFADIPKRDRDRSWHAHNLHRILSSQVIRHFFPRENNQSLRFLQRGVVERSEGGKTGGETGHSSLPESRVDGGD